LQRAMREHANTHTVQCALGSVRKIHAIMGELSERGLIPNKNAMQVYLQHCCAKSATFGAESACFDAADLALDMIERHQCGFHISTVVEISMHISLRAEMSRAESFVRRLVAKSLKHLPENERRFLARHLVFVIGERKAAADESLSKAETFAERGLDMDWESSTAQEFHLYNDDSGVRKCYKPVEGYGFARKGLVALLSIDHERSGLDGFDYSRQRDGALVDVVKAKDGEPLVVRLRTQVNVPFRQDACYRLDDIDVADLQAKRAMEALRILGRDPDPQCCRLRPNPRLCEILSLPLEEPYAVRLVLKDSGAYGVRVDGQEWDFCEYGAEPVRVRSIGSGALMDWNAANPGNTIRIGDRVSKVNGVSDRESIVDEIAKAQTFRRYELAMTLMRKVKIQDSGVRADARLPSAGNTERLLQAEEEALRERLNASQVEAIRRAATQQLCLIQGPPGTGKTTTALELLDFLLRNKVVPTPILVSGHTNAAVDNILAGLILRGRRVVRIGEGDKIRPDCRPYMFGEELAAEPSMADVVCATCSGSGSGVLSREGVTFHSVLIDECTQATETSCLVPICRAAQHLVLIGDQCQLQPFVKTELAGTEGLGNSLFNRLCQQGVRPEMLDTQYRMHPGICEFPSVAFYDGRLLSGVGRAERPPPSGWQWPSRTAPVCFIDARDGQETEGEGKVEKKNEHEVLWVLSALRQLLTDPELKRVRECGTYPVGIVTPYAAQKALIMRALEMEGLVDANGKHLVETNSVDGFQGREKDVIIFSAVRANDWESVGFLHDWRRINVMLTRAKRGLIVVGHRATLQSDVYWREWLSWAASRGCIRGEPAWGEWTSRCLIEEDWAARPKKASAVVDADLKHGDEDWAFQVQDEWLASDDSWAFQPQDAWSDDGF